MKNIKTLVLSALFLAIGMVLPLLTGQIKEIGDSLLPMHLAVMLCGAICGWKYGLFVGLLLPIFRSLIFGMPPLYPNAVYMTLELGTYGFVIGGLYGRCKKYSGGYLFFSIICAMICGRIVWGITKAILLGVTDKPFGIKAFLVGGFFDAAPGLVLQLILVPFVLSLIERTKNKSFTENKK